jgi:hypothetical protein
MRTASAIAICVAISGVCMGVGAAGAQPQPDAVASSPGAAATGDELHFVSVLTMRGEVAAVDPANRLVTLRDSTGQSSTLEVRSDKDLDAIKVGDPVVARYFEGAQIGKAKVGGAVPIQTLKSGLGSQAQEPTEQRHALFASVKAVDRAHQEVTLKGPDSSLETIMVTNPEELGHLKAGDRVSVTLSKGLVLSLEKQH